jgi:hypothetical protein
MSDTAISEKQLAANRANAARSTGPRTPEGKARSAQNARKHGFTSSSYNVLKLEPFDGIANLRADLIAHYRPTDAQELFAIERIAIAQAALLRAARLEAGFFADCLIEAVAPTDKRLDAIAPMSAEIGGSGDPDLAREQNRNYMLAEGFRRIARESNSWSLLLRYQAQTERNYRRAIESLEALRAEPRPADTDLPNEPIFDPQPEENESAIPAETNPSVSPVYGVHRIDDIPLLLEPETSQTSTPLSNSPTPPQVPDSTTEPPNPPPDAVEDSYGVSLQQKSTARNHLKSKQINTSQIPPNGPPCALTHSVERKATQ